MEHKAWLKYIKLMIRADFNTGKLYWKVSTGGRCMGDEVGCLDTKFYIKVNVGGRSTYAHRIIYFLYHDEWPEGMLDHFDRKPWNNKPGNLRPTTYSKNALNSKLWVSNTTGVKGVSWSLTNRKYKVTVQGKYYGYFDSLEKAKEEAYNAYNKNP